MVAGYPIPFSHTDPIITTTWATDPTSVMTDMAIILRMLENTISR